MERASGPACGPPKRTPLHCHNGQQKPKGAHKISYFCCKFEGLASDWSNKSNWKSKQILPAAFAQQLKILCVCFCTAWLEIYLGHSGYLWFKCLATCFCPLWNLARLHRGEETICIHGRRISSVPSQSVTPPLNFDSLRYTPVWSRAGWRTHVIDIWSL